MKTIINIDASSLSAAGCILHWKRVVVDGYREKVPGPALVYGSAVHKYIETMYITSGNIPKAREAAYEVFRRTKSTNTKSAYLLDERHLLVTCFNVWEEAVLKDSNFELLLLPNGKPAVEVNFSLPYYEDESFIVRLAGTIDRIGKIRNGCYCIRDWKTTSKYNIPEYLSEYKMSKQLRFYRLAMTIMSRLHPESVLGQIGSQMVGSQIDGVFLKSKASDNEYKSSDVFMFSEETMTEFEAVLNAQIKRLVTHLHSDNFPREGIVVGTCKTDYKCKFWGVCGAPNAVQQTMLDRDFSKVHYDPLNFSGEKTK